MAFETERRLMVEKQLRSRSITDARILNVMENVPRHEFVKEDVGAMAYGDYPLPVGHGQTISQPYMVALMTEALELKGNEKVLEIGTGSGYQAAVLAELVSNVYTVERIPELAAHAKRILAKLGYINVWVKVGDGTKGWEENSPYEGIVVTAGAPHIPSSLIDQLAVGGRLVIPVGSGFSQELTVVLKKKGKVVKNNLCGCVFVPLIGEDGWEK